MRTFFSFTNIGPHCTGIAGLKIGEKNIVQFPSVDDVRVEPSHSFATVTDVLVVRAAMVVVFATIFVAVSRPDYQCQFS